VWHASLSAGNSPGPTPLAELTRRQLREMEEIAWDLIGRNGRPDMTVWNASDHVIHLRRALTELELVAVQALAPDFLSCPAVDIAGDPGPYRPLTGLGAR
jgi:hypothetical protein